MATLQNWDTCCKEAIAAAIQLGIKVATNSRTPFLQQNNDVVTSMQEYGREHLHELSVELMAEYLHSIVLYLHKNCMQLDEHSWLQILPTEKRLLR